jgi:hypothetical protein
MKDMSSSTQISSSDHDGVRRAHPVLVPRESTAEETVTKKKGTGVIVWLFIALTTIACLVAAYHMWLATSGQLP